MNFDGSAVETGLEGLVVHLQTFDLVEASDLAATLQGISWEFDLFCEQRGFVSSSPLMEEETYPQLRIREIRAGSITIDLAIAIPATFAVMEAANVSADFFDHLKRAVQSVTVSNPTSAAPCSESDANVQHLLQSIANDPHGRITISVHGDVNAPIIVTTNQVSANRMGSAGTHPSVKTPGRLKICKEVLLEFTTTQGVKVDDVGLIRSLAHKPCKLFGEEADFFEMLTDLNCSYLVDVEVLYRRSQPCHYRVLKVHRRLTDDPSFRGSAS